MHELNIIGNNQILIPSVTVMELYRGMRDKKEMADMQKKVKNYNILHFDNDVSRHAIELVNKYKLSHNL